jgi:hypothetical protein
VSDVRPVGRYLTGGFMMKIIESMHRFRLHPLSAAIGLALFVSNAPAWSLGLGSADVRSHLGEPLRLVVPVRLGGGETISEECLRITNSNIDDGIPVITGARTSLQASAANGMSVLVVSRDPVLEPVVKVVLAAGCGAGIEREFVLLLDPPGSVTVVGDESAPGEKSQAQQSAAQKLPVAVNGRSGSADGSSLSGTANGHAEPTTASRPVKPPIMRKPKAPNRQLPGASSDSPPSQPGKNGAQAGSPTLPGSVRQGADRLRLDGPQLTPGDAGKAASGAGSNAQPVTSPGSATNGNAAPLPEPISPSAREEALIAQLTALGTEIQNLKKEMAEQAARNQALRDDATPSWWLYVLLGAAAAAIVAVLGLLFRIKRMQRAAAHEAWWTDTKLKAETGREVQSEGLATQHLSSGLSSAVGSKRFDSQQTDASIRQAAQAAAALRADLELTFPEHLHDARIEVEELGATQAMRVLSKSGAELTAINPLKTAVAVRTQSIPALDFDLGEIAPNDADALSSVSNSASASTSADLDVWSQASVENSIRATSSVSTDPMPGIVETVGSTMSWAQARQAQGYLRQVAEAIEQSDAYLAAGQSESAASVLRRLIQEKEGVPRAPWLMLLHIYRKADKRDAYEGLSQKFSLQFGRAAPTWDTVDSAGSELGLDSDPQLLQSIWAKWGSAESMSLLSKLLYERQVPDENFFNLTLQRDLLNFVKICPLDGA